jgi:membrane-associated protease RseP (regulator of RpoE activity)
MRKNWLAPVCGALAGLIAPGPASAVEAVNYAAAIPIWQAYEARLLSIGWRLARANAPLCQRSPSAIGLMLADVHQFKEPDRARVALGISGDVIVEAVAAGSPAQAAGLRAGTQVLAIGGQAVTGLADANAKDYAAGDVLHDRIDSLLAASGNVTLRIAAPGQPPRDVTVVGEHACRARFAMLRSGTTAGTRGFTIEIAVQLLAETPSDDEAATMLAHELAHNIFGHWQRTLATGRNNYLATRQSEREADRMAPWLMANSGYDPAAAPRFFTAWGQRHGGGITRAPTHDSWQDRVAAVTAELPAIAAARQSSGGSLADWRTRFASRQAD